MYKRQALEELTETELVRVMSETKNSISAQYQHLFKLDEIQLEFTTDAYEAIAKEAKESASGARAIRSIFEAILQDLMFDLPSEDNVKKIVINKEDLEAHVVDLLQKIPNNKLLLDHYLDGAIEAEADAICDGKNVYIIGIMEHIEPCGIHSGDSNATLPVFNLGEFVVQQIKDHTQKIAKALNTVGLINIQFAVKGDKVFIIEANPRASRTVPFISKAYKEPYVNYATKVMLGKKKVSDFKFNPKLEGFAIKQPVLSLIHI